MDNITEEDKKLLETLGLSDIPEQEKQVVLEEIDNKMTRRFIANLLVSLEPDKARELEAEVQNIPSENTQEIIEKIIAKHPDATKVLQDSAKEIMDELQAKGGEKGVGSEGEDVGRKEWGAGSKEENIANDNDQKQDQQEALVVDLGDEATKAENKSGAQGVGSREWGVGEEITAQDTTAPEEPAKPNMSDLGSFAQPAEEKSPVPSPFASVATPGEPQPSSEPVAEDKLPVPQEEPASPFGDEIKIVKDDEPTPNVIAPTPGGQDVGGERQGAGLRAQDLGEERQGVGSEEKDLGFRTQGAGEETIDKDTTVPEAPVSPSSDLNPFTADKPEPSALESVTAQPTGQPILPDSQTQSSDQIPMPAAPAVIPDEPADAPIVTPAAPSSSAYTPADVTPSPITAPDSTDNQPPQTNQPQSGASDYYQP